MLPQSHRHNYHKHHNALAGPQYPFVLLHRCHPDFKNNNQQHKKLVTTVIPKRSQHPTSHSLHCNRTIFSSSSFPSLHILPSVHHKAILLSWYCWKSLRHPERPLMWKSKGYQSEILRITRLPSWSLCVSENNNQEFHDLTDWKSLVFYELFLIKACLCKWSMVDGQKTKWSMMGNIQEFLELTNHWFSELFTKPCFW